MAVGRVIVAHRSEAVRSAVVAGLRARGIVCEVARQAAEVVLMQAATRSDAVLMDMEWAAEESGCSLLSALQRDAAHPYVLVSRRRQDKNHDRAMQRMGAGDVVSEEETGLICEMIERNLCRRNQAEEDGDCPFCCALSRAFAECGLPCHLRGCRYLMFAARMLVSGEGSLDYMGNVYSRASERFGCSRSAIERGMSQAVQLMRQRACDHGTDSVQGFLSRMMEETRHVTSAPSVRPKVVVFVEGTRRFF